MNPASTVILASEQPTRNEGNFPLKQELIFFAALIGLLNLPLFVGYWNAAFTFYPDSVTQGEWWRVITFPFVHVSIYNFALDVSGFFLLYSGLQEKSRFVRIGYFVASALSSLLLSIFAAPEIRSVGLCGLSGVAHGLMAISGLELLLMKNDRTLQLAGGASLGVIVLKSAIEAVTGQVLFSNFHIGNIGTPIAVCHAGGVIGALIVWMLHSNFGRRNISRKPSD